MEDLSIVVPEDTVDVEFTVTVRDNRVPGMSVSTNGDGAFGIFYRKLGWFRPKLHLIDSFRAHPEGQEMSYDESVRVAKEFFERYLRSKTLQRAYAQKILSL